MRVTCTDFYGKAHSVDSNDLIDRLSVYGICIVDNKVLLIKDPRSLRWELPGGGVEQGETESQGLVREFMEEAGVVPEGLSFLTEWQEHFFDVVSNQAWRSQRKFYLVNSIGRETSLLKTGNGEDSAKAEFVAIDTLEDLHIAGSTKDIIGLALKTLEPNSRSLR